MSIARYPRPGRRIAPHSLAKFLSEPLPAAVLGEAGGPLLLKDLDGSAWARLGNSASRRAAGEVVTAVARRIQAVGRLRVAALPDRLEWHDLDLGVRAYNALTSHRKLARPASLTGWPIAELMKTRAFGVKSLVDLLAALEDATGLRTVVEGGDHETGPMSSEVADSVSRRAGGGSGVDDVLRRLPVFLESRLQEIPERLQWADLGISVRVHNSLVIRRGISRPAGLTGMSVNDLMRGKNFGRKSLRDLLTALEKATGRLCLQPGATAPELSVPERPLRGQGEVPLDLVAGKEAKQRSLDLAVELMKLEQALGPDVVRARDPRFGAHIQALSIGCSDTSELLAILPAKLERAGTRHEKTLQTLRDLRAGLDAARGLDLLVELDAIVRSICKDAYVKIILRLWGWDGRGGATLQQVGDEHGLSRERVRQITTRAKEELETRGRIFAPAAIRALEIAQGILPAPPSTVVDALVEQGLVPLDADLRFLGDLGQSLGRPASFRFDAHYGCFASTHSGERLVAEVHRQASRLGSKYGAACVEDVTDALRTQSASPPRTESVSRLLRARPDLLWLDDEHLWFCKQQTAGNLLLNRVHKVVAVAGRVRISELRGGVTRDYLLKGSVPPKAILLRLCCHDPALEIDGEVVAKREQAALEAALSPAERTLWRVLLHNGSVMERSQLERECLATGLGRPSFQSALTYSPIVIRYAAQVYGLRGVAIPPGAVASIQPRGTRKGRLLLDSGWAGNGHVRLVYRLSEGCVSNGSITIPASFTRFLQGDFRLLRLGNPVGTLRCRGAQGWGLGPLFRRVSAEAGDTLTLEFDLQKSEAQASLTAEPPEESMIAEVLPRAGVAPAVAGQ